MTTLAATVSSLGVPTPAQQAVDEDATLVREFLDGGDPMIFAELIRRYERPVFRLTASVLGPGFEAAAEDLTQEIFVHVFHKLSTFRFASRFSTWLYRVAYRKAIDEKRKARYQKPHVGEAVLDRIASRDSDPLDQALEAESARGLRRAVDALTEPHRTAVLLFYWMERPVEEIAELLGSRPATVRSYLFRARERLRRALESPRFASASRAPSPQLLASGSISISRSGVAGRAGFPRRRRTQPAHRR